tara:strand:- start:226 stop:846 length:621 start_codon:yes stop_codon:yes gene_type:complete
VSKIISIDGPSGSGKTTIAKLLAKRLKSEYLSTGALYRSLSYIYINEGKDLSYIYDNLNIQNIDKKNIQVNQKVVDIKDLYTKEITDYTSKLSQRVDIRDIVTKSVRDHVKDNDLTVVEGRDIGSVVFKDALIKIYLDSPLELRAKRRVDQSMNAEGYDSIADRDEQDRNRLHSPLIIPNGAFIIDNENISVEDIVNQIINEYESL